jgi:isoquinoline 1-oxidoreductase
MDELAKELAMDPLAFRMKNLSDSRLKAVFQAAADKFGWAKRQAASGRGFGIAGGNEKGGYIALCAEVEVEKPSGRVHIRRIAAAFECGAIVNPNGLRNQVEGAIIQGIGGALFEAIRFENGRLLNPHFAQYRLPRFPDVPPIELGLLDRTDLPSAGAGECPIVALAPAVANGIFEATGQRRRGLPLEGLAS